MTISNIPLVPLLLKYLNTTSLIIFHINKSKIFYLFITFSIYNDGLKAHMIQGRLAYPKAHISSDSNTFQFHPQSDLVFLKHGYKFGQTLYQLQYKE